MHEAFDIARAGAPVRWLSMFRRIFSSPPAIDRSPKDFPHKGYRPKVKAELDHIQTAIDLMQRAGALLHRGGVINSGLGRASCRELVKVTGFPITSTLMGLGAYAASDPQWLGLGMHGTLEANLAMHDCDLMTCIGARFDDRITGRLDGFRRGQTRSMSISTHPRSTRT